jgi:Domain of unknown function (DUF4872)/Butirosin biosynthesis protein H, N-terminal
MPQDKDFKRLVRARMGRTGESYTTARARLRPNDPTTAPAPLRGRHPDTTALTRLLAALGVTDPASGRPLDEPLVLGVSGGIGFAYFVFEYQDLATLYLGGRLNPYVHKQDATEAALTRLGIPVQLRRTSGPATAERQLRDALDRGHPVIATVDPARLRHRSVPAEQAGMTPQDVLVDLDGDAPVLWDLAPTPIPLTWPELAHARAGVRSARHRLVVAEPPPAPVDLARAAAAGIADTWSGMLQPPMTNFGVPGLTRWADLLTTPRNPKGWPRLLATPARQFQFLTWLYDWIETAGTGGGFFRAMYARFLEEAAGPLARPELTALAADYRTLATTWTTLARTAIPAGNGPLTQAETLLTRRRHLLEEQGPTAADELTAIQHELATLAADPRPLDPADLATLLTDLQRQVVLHLTELEDEAATTLRDAVPATPDPT